MSSIFTISLDFELHWGGFEKWPLDESKRKYFDETRMLIPRLLEIFVNSDVHVTWATVGLLKYKNKATLMANLPNNKPNYKNTELSAYHYINELGIGDDEESDPYHYAHSLVNLIKQSPGQELGTHTFAHYYCNEEGQTILTFQDDLKAAKVASKQFGLNLQSLVFPRNQINSQYLEICYQEGIKIVRSNPVDWWWQIGSTENESYWKRLNRGVDAYFSIGGKTSYPLESIKKNNNVLLMPASRLLRPYNPKEYLLNDLKINRIKNEMTIAAQASDVYHLWWHPHNFGNHPEENMTGLQEIIEHYTFLNSEYGMKSLNMGEVSELIESK
jgi:peptidoglycan/xylan/chitin deacetylase (PgdA/CDA1 family)